MSQQGSEHDEMVDGEQRRYVANEEVVEEVPIEAYDESEGQSQE